MLFPKRRKIGNDYDSRVWQWITEIPKVEIHLHLEGMVTRGLLFRLLKKNGIRLPGVLGVRDLEKKFRIRNLHDFLRLFIKVIQPAIKEEEDLRPLLHNATHYFLRNRISYAEVIFSPARFLQAGLSYEGMVAVMREEMERIQELHGIQMYLLVDVSRGYGEENAMQILDLMIQYPCSRILGISLGGSDRIRKGRFFSRVFAKARSYGYRTVAHAGEDSGPSSIWDVIRCLQCDRIGHGTSAYQDRALVEYLRQKQLPVEICLTSNLRTGHYVHSLKRHPVTRYFREGLLVSLSSDDPGIFGSELNDEFFLLYKKVGFSIEELLAVLRLGILSSFMTEEEKARSLRELGSASERLRRELDL